MKNLVFDHKIIRSETLQPSALAQIEIIPNNINRPIREKNLEYLRNSVSKWGIFRSIIIIYTNAFGGKFKRLLGDGQHLTRIAIELGLPLHAYTIRLDSIDEIINFVSTINSDGNRWSLLNHLESRTNAGYPSYDFLNQEFKKYNFATVSAMGDVYSKTTNFHRDLFKRGVFSVDEERGQYILDLFDKCTAAGLANTSSALQAVARFYKKNQKDFSEERFVNTIKDRAIFNQRNTVNYYTPLFNLFYK